MRWSVQRIVTAVAVGTVLLFVMFVVNQVAQLVLLADRISPVLGTVILCLTVLVVVLCFVVPLYRLLRMPRSLTPPGSDEGPEFEAYLDSLRRRLRKNPRLSGQAPNSRAEIEAALNTLGRHADEITRDTALQVFVSTAVLQNGSLDAFAVLVAQCRMVYHIACIYNQRPALGQLVRLYANVAASAFLARQLEEIDLSEYVQPLVSAAFTSAVGSALTGGNGLLNLVTNSLLTGSANAYLTLRVGVIAKTYCGALVVPERRAVARSATLEAAKMIPSVAKEASSRVAQAFKQAVKSASGTLVKGAADKVKDVSSEIGRGISETATGVWEKVRRTVRKQEDAGGKEKTDAF